MNRREADKLWDEVEANHRKLDGCQGPHDFAQVDPGPSKLGATYRCQKCGGTVGHLHKLWYEIGLRHGRAHP
jgi:hypothetical protein